MLMAAACAYLDPAKCVQSAHAARVCVIPIGSRRSSQRLSSLAPQTWLLRRGGICCFFDCQKSRSPDRISFKGNTGSYATVRGMTVYMVRCLHSLTASENHPQNHKID